MALLGLPVERRTHVEHLGDPGRANAVNVGVVSAVSTSASTARAGPTAGCVWVNSLPRRCRMTVSPGR